MPQASGPAGPGASLSLAEGRSAGAITRRDLDGEACEVVTATATAATFDEARSHAEAEGRAALLRFQRQRMRQDLRAFVAEEQVSDQGGVRTRSRVETESLLVARSEGELRHVRVLHADAVAGAVGYSGRATLACPVRHLFPHERLQAALAREDSPLEALLALAIEYEAEGQVLLAEEALRWASNRGGGACAALALAEHLGRRRLEADSLRWYSLAEGLAGAEAAIAMEARQRIADIRSRTETAQELADQLLRLAEARRGPDFTAVAKHVERTDSSDQVAWQVNWTINGPVERRVLKMWFDDSLAPAWWADKEGIEPGPSRPRHGFSFPVNRGHPVTRVLLWALPVDCELWPGLVAWRNAEVRLGAGECSEADRFRLRDLVEALRRVDVVAAVVQVRG